MDAAEHVDVVIVGAGLSGIGAACHLRRAFPGRTFAILEGRDAIGGTWDLFRYPGVRSDSDMYTLGYAFRPWRGPESLAGGAAIRDYIRATAQEHGVDRAVRFGHRVVQASWSSARARWTVEARTGRGGEPPDDRPAGASDVRLTCSFLFMCTGYYRYDEGYTPDFPGIGDFAGRVVHPQHWPAGLDHTGRRVVVIGSGATAVTLVPALAERAGHVTMLQRSPSYVLSLPSRDPVAQGLLRALPVRVAAPAVRWKNVLLSLAFFQFSRRAPEAAKALLRRGVTRRLPPGYDVGTHFTPAYDPWDQRLSLVQDGDLFAALREGRASVVTDRIETFTASGLRLASGGRLDADLVVTATGLNLLALGGARLVVDGAETVPADTVAYKGMMLSGVPNLAFTIGYVNASWTLRADLVARYVCRLLRHMDAHGYDVCTPRSPDRSLPLGPLLDLTSGYVRRGLGALPKQGPAAPWRVPQNYPRDAYRMRRGPVADQGVRFGRAAGPGGWIR
ncbi:flavin-containing monooxygenase [Streptomyces sp. NPDC017056]|uniref:flavin-containing monooxygenase n=1 Tax=Streptomyces sp. NPDC017056 TaxID=3364973 RepID=UPI00379ED739